MSREIDYDNLSADDIAYLVDRPWLPQPSKAAKKAAARAVAAATSPEPATEEDEEELELESEGTEGEEEELEEVATDWSELSYSELKAACSERGLPKTGNRDELIARLEANDEVEG